MGTFDNDRGKAYEEYYDLTLKQLREWGCMFKIFICKDQRSLSWYPYPITPSEVIDIIEEGKAVAIFQGDLQITTSMTKESTPKTSSIKIVPKGWGHEKWIVNNEMYCGKILFMEKNKRCSWHYHKSKR